MNEEIQQTENNPTEPNEEELTAEISEEPVTEEESELEQESVAETNDDELAAETSEEPITEEESAPEQESAEPNEDELLAETSEELEAKEESEVEQEPEVDEFPAELELAAGLDLPPILDMFDEETGEAKFSEIAASDENLTQESDEATESTTDEQITATSEELKPVIEALLFVADEPLPFKQLCKVLGDVPEEEVKTALEELVADHETRGSGLEIREIAGGWRLSTRPQNHEFIRKYLKSRPSARLSLPALETLAVIAYKQPITIPEILEIRSVSSSSAIKTLLEKRLIVTKGRKETVGRPMMYGTSREFLIQFGLKDLNELPSFEDFEDLAQ